MIVCFPVDFAFLFFFNSSVKIDKDKQLVILEEEHEVTQPLSS